MGELIMTLGCLGWMMGAVGVLALWVDLKARQERELRERQLEAGSQGDKGAR